MVKISDINRTLFQDNEFSLKELVEKNKFNLRGVNLTGANLEGVDLTDATLSVFSKWNVSYKLNSKSFETSDLNEVIIIIGCKEKTIQEWDYWFNSDKEFETRRDTKEFKQIQGNYIAVREFLKFMVKGED